MRQHKVRNPHNQYEGWTNVFIMHRASCRRNQSAGMSLETRAKPRSRGPDCTVEAGANPIANELKLRNQAGRSDRSKNRRHVAQDGTRWHTFEGRFGRETAFGVTKFESASRHLEESCVNRRSTRPSRPTWHTLAPLCPIANDPRNSSIELLRASSHGDTQQRPNVCGLEVRIGVVGEGLTKGQARRDTHSLYLLLMPRFFL